MFHGNLSYFYMASLHIKMIDDFTWEVSVILELWFHDHYAAKWHVNFKYRNTFSPLMIWCCCESGCGLAFDLHIRQQKTRLFILSSWSSRTKTNKIQVLGKKKISQEGSEHSTGGINLIVVVPTFPFWQCYFGKVWPVNLWAMVLWVRRKRSRWWSYWSVKKGEELVITVLKKNRYYSASFPFSS